MRMISKKFPQGVSTEWHFYSQYNHTPPPFYHFPRFIVPLFFSQKAGLRCKSTLIIPWFTASLDIQCIFLSPEMHGKLGYDCISTILGFWPKRLPAYVEIVCKVHIYNNKAIMTLKECLRLPQ